MMIRKITEQYKCKCDFTARAKSIMIKHIIIKHFYELVSLENQLEVN